MEIGGYRHRRECGCPDCEAARKQIEDRFRFGWTCSCGEKRLGPLEELHAQAQALAHRNGRIYHFVSICPVKR